MSIWLRCKEQLIFAAQVHDSELINAHDCERSYHLLTVCMCCAAMLHVLAGKH